MHAHPLEARIAHVEGAFEQVNERLGSIDRRLDAMDTRFNHIEGRFGLIDARFNRVDSRFNWLIGTIVAAWVTTIATQIGTTLTILLHH